MPDRVTDHKTGGLFLDRPRRLGSRRTPLRATPPLPLMFAVARSISPDRLARREALARGDAVLPPDWGSWLG